ncbi:MAG: TIR domain-containing protein [Chloroflexi bacterium]|nr:TIR domain-containing protein [Chloroflexota bacterium]
MCFVFISHSSHDDATVTVFSDRLLHNSVENWVDHIHNDQSANLYKEIQEKLNSCASGLLILSNESAKSDAVTGEWLHILALGKLLYIAKIEHIEEHDMPWRLRPIPWIDLSSDQEHSFNELIDAIRGRRKLDPNGEQVYVHRRFTSSGAIDPRLLINIFGRNEDLDTIRSLLDRGRPTFVTGIGGIGKSRLAYEIALSIADVNGVIWHVCSDVSSPNDILKLLRDHFGLPQETPTENVIDRLRSQTQLIVIDNAESVQKRDLRSAYANLANLLSQAGAQILLTSREKWGQLARASEYTPQDLSLEPALEVCRAMCELEDVTLTDEQMQELATKAYLHPGFIDFAVSLTKNRGFDRTIKQLDTLQGRKVEDALHEMILQSVEQMKTSDSAYGSMAVETFRRLNVCRGGFTFQAAEALTIDRSSNILPQNDDDLDEALGLLQQWKFVRLDHERKRYNIGSLVTAAIGEDDAVYDLHYKYYKSLAIDRTRIDDFHGLDPDIENLTAAFERKLEQGCIRDAFFLCQNCTRLFFNRVRFGEWQDWLARVKPMIETDGDDELNAHLMEALGDSHAHTHLGNRTENLKHAISYYEKALEYFTVQECSPKCAALLHNLGLAYQNLFESEKHVHYLHDADRMETTYLSEIGFTEESSRFSEWLTTV